jgi:tol-pal system protein YbgF
MGLPGSILLGLAALALAALCGCASNSPAAKPPSGDPSLPEIDVLQLKENSDEALKLAQENKLEMQSLSSKVRELESRMSSLGDEIANLPLVKLDELTQQLALITQQMRALEEKTSRAPAPAPAAPVKKELSTFSPAGITPEKQDSGKSPESAKAGKSAGSGAAKAGLGKNAGATRTADGASRKPQATDAEAALYKKAFDLYYGKDYGQAISKFEELVQKFPAGTYADNCHYWIGECHFAMGNFAKAVASFRKVLTFPETEKADDAQLKLGYCHLRLGERKQAAEEFKKVVSLYPESEYTERAKEELAKLE